VPSIEQARMEVDQQLQAVLAVVTDTGMRKAAHVEMRLWSSLLALGRALMGLFFAARAEAWREGRAYELGGTSFEVVGHESALVGTRFGKVEVMRPVGRVVGQDRVARDMPLERELDLPGGFTLPVVLTVAKFCAHMAFAPARALLRGLFEWAPSPRTVLRMVDAVGKHARPYLEAAPAPEGDGEVLVITVDGKGAPAISSREYGRRARPHGTKRQNRRHARRGKRREYPRVRRAPGKKSKNAKMAAVGVLYSLRRDADGKLDGPVNKRAYATFESYRALFTWIHAEAVKRGYGTARFSKVLFIADGADVLWSLQQEFFPDADVCLDWFHVVEKLWSAGKAINRGTRRKRRELEAWVATQKKRLRAGKLDEVIEELRTALAATPPTGPGNKYRRKVLGEVLAHYEKNAARMQYARLRRQDLEISSGIVEGAVRHLVGVRLDGPGMRWGRDRMEAVLHLRCVLINGMWDDFERYVARRAKLRLLSQPIPTRTHDAIKKAA
jgi:hypothetical protein